MKKVPFNEYMSWQIDHSGLTQKEIAERVGYKNPNIITMLKKGSTRFPIDKIPQIASAIGFDPSIAIRMALQEYNPGLLSVVEKFFGFALSENEKSMIVKMRELANNKDPSINSKAKEQALEEFINKIL